MIRRFSQLSSSAGNSALYDSKISDWLTNRSDKIDSFRSWIVHNESSPRRVSEGPKSNRDLDQRKSRSRSQRQRFRSRYIPVREHHRAHQIQLSRAASHRSTQRRPILQPDTQGTLHTVIRWSSAHWQQSPLGRSLESVRPESTPEQHLQSEQKCTSCSYHNSCNSWSDEQQTLL